MLVLTSFLIGTVSLHAAMLHQHYMALIFLLLFGTSTSHHSNYASTTAVAKFIYSADHALARMAWLHVLMRCLYLPALSVVGTYVCLAYVSLVYLTIHSHSVYDQSRITSTKMLHGTMHLACCVGSHLLLWRIGAGSIIIMLKYPALDVYRL